MADRFDKFSQHARRVLTYAQQESQTLGHDFIGAEHLLLGLLRDEESSAVRVLGRLGVDPSKIREQVLFVLGPDGGTGHSGGIGLTPNAKRVIESAVDEVRRAGVQTGIRSAHLLLGVARVEDTIAAGVLQSMGLALDRLREAVDAVLPAAPASEPEPLLTDAPEFDGELATLRELRLWFDRALQSGPGPTSDIGAMLLRDVDELITLLNLSDILDGRLRASRRALELIGRLIAGARALAMVLDDADAGGADGAGLTDALAAIEPLAKRLR